METNHTNGVSISLFVSDVSFLHIGSVGCGTCLTLQIFSISVYCYNVAAEYCPTGLLKSLLIFHLAEKENSFISATVALSSVCMPLSMWSLFISGNMSFMPGSGCS